MANYPWSGKIRRPEACLVCGAGAFSPAWLFSSSGERCLDCWDLKIPPDPDRVAAWKKSVDAQIDAYCDKHGLDRAEEEARYREAEEKEKLLLP